MGRGGGGRRTLEGLLPLSLLDSRLAPADTNQQPRIPRESRALQEDTTLDVGEAAVADAAEDATSNKIDNYRNQRGLLILFTFYPRLGQPM